MLAETMNIILIGSRGQLGRELVKQSKHSDFKVLAVDLPQFNITDPAQIKKTFTNFQPDLAINAAAYTNVDRAETESDIAFAVNQDGPAYLARVCAKADIPLIHVSTDFVFDGKKKTLYVESDQVNPLSVYGKSKAAGENEVRSFIEKHIIIRTSWLYSVHGHNFVKTMLQLGNEKKSIQVVSDQSGSPTSATDLAETILTVAARIQNSSSIDWGTYHYCSRGVTTWHGFAETIFDLAGRYGSTEKPEIEPVTTGEYPAKAKRPIFSALDCTRIKECFGVNPKPWQESLQVTIESLLTRINK